MPSNLPSSARSALREAAAHEAGRELDALIAERVMGYVWHAWDDLGFSYLLLPTDTELGEESIARRRNGEFEVGEYSGPHYSTDIAAAWLVVEKLVSQGHDVVIRPNGIAYDGVARVEIGLCVDGSYSSDGEYCADAPTTPLAICRAYLAASPTGGTTE